MYNEIDTIEGANGPEIKINGKSYINLSSNNYLGLATNEDLKSAAKAAIDTHGVGAGAVRTINGTLDLHDELEETLAKFKGTEAAIAYQSGFNCNMAAISAVMNKMMLFYQMSLIMHQLLMDVAYLKLKLFELIIQTWMIYVRKQRSS